MKKLTKAQRRKIYLEAAKVVNNSHAYNICGCFAISEAAQGNGYLWRNEFLNNYPEYSLFSPEDYLQGNAFFRGENERKERITALLLASEMCK